MSCTVLDNKGVVVIDGKTYVSEGNHTIIVTLPTAVAGWADAYISSCYSDYSKPNGGNVVLFPDAEKKVWTVVILVDVWNI